MAGFYDYRLVAVSVLVAILASYTALDLGARVTASRGRVRLWWIIGGAWSMGIAIWSMHYLGMLAFRLPVPVQYDWPTVLLSLLTAILGSAGALFVVSRSTVGFLEALVGGILQGGGIVALHYIAMASMRLPAHMHYSLALTTLAVAIAIGGSLISLWLTFYFRNDPSGRILRKGQSALLMGVGIASMHYTAMAAVSFSSSTQAPELSHSVGIASLGTAGLVAVSLMVPLLTLLASLADRLEKQGVLLDELFEQAPQAVALTDVHDRVMGGTRIPSLTSRCEKWCSTPPSLAGLEMSVNAHVRDQAEPVTAGFDADSHTDSYARGYNPVPSGRGFRLFA